MKFSSVLITAGLIGALMGCGGSSSTGFNVFTAGDSLSDSGTFGFRFTIAGTESAPNLVWPELVAAAVGATAPCPRYRAAGGGKVEVNPAATSCGGYAVGGARINPTGEPADSTPLSVLQQIRDIARERRPVSERDIVLISGGGNDVAAVFELWLNAQGSADAATTYRALMVEALGAGVPANLPDTATRSKIGLQYMAKLADLMADTLQDQLLASGARRIVVANVPDITRTPKLLAVLTALQLDPAALAATTEFGTALAVAFNQQLAARVTGESRIAVYDLFGALNAWVTDPPPEFTQATTPACPRTNPGLAALPTYAINTCSAAELSSAAVAAGRRSDWWETYLFSDDFHPTPRGHIEAAKKVTQILLSRGWN